MPESPGRMDCKDCQVSFWCAMPTMTCLPTLDPVQVGLGHGDLRRRHEDGERGIHGAVSKTVLRA